MQRGEIWWANTPLPTGRRPVVLVSRNRVYSVRDSVTVVPITRTIRGVRTEVSLGADDGLPRECVANVDGILTIEKSCLTERIAALCGEKLRLLSAAITFVLALDE